MKTKQVRTVATITATEYKSTSINGNPSRWVWFTDSEGNELKGYTGSDHACGYGVTNYLNKQAEIVYHRTRKGNVIIEFINNIK